MLPNLKLQIFRRGSQQNLLAKAVGIDETVLSKIIRGSRLPTLVQRGVLAKYLEAEESWLFERFESVPRDSGHRRTRGIRGAGKTGPQRNGTAKANGRSRQPQAGKQPTTTL